MQIDFRNVQATVVHLYKCPISRHLLFRFSDVDGGTGFLRRLIARVTMADFRFESTPDPLLNVGLSFDGLRALGVDQALLDDLDAVYKAGPEPSPLGDAPGSRSDPETWWERQFRTQDVHCVVNLYVRSDGALEPACLELRGLAAQFGLSELTPRGDGTALDARSLGGARLHFGYVDGISHPDICWDDVPDTPAQINFRNFLLGYATSEYSSAPEGGPAADLVRDSTYAAFRWIYQDVATFNKFLKDEGSRLFPRLAPPDAEELLAAKMMGRWRDGTPLVLSPDRPDADLALANDFGYADVDENGVRCPFSAHIRVVNPRDQELDPIVEGIPRVIRRGMPYGPPLDSTEDDGQDRGIVGIFLCADLKRQIYTLTGWIKRNDFSPVYDPDRRVQDVLLGNRAVAGTAPRFRIPHSEGVAVVAGLPDFVHTKGTLFLLYPSGSTLARLVQES